MEKIDREKFYNRLYLYPSDFHYLQAIGRAVGVGDDELWRLYSLMGAQELSNTLPLAKYNNFRFDDNNPDEFRFNLHTHSVYSDGSLIISEWLEAGKNLADQRAQINDDLPPFTVALTDHDCVDGNKEIVKLLIKDPEKYQNLRVVLGAELGAVWKDESCQKIPLEYELIWFALNPFDKQISDFLSDHQQKRFRAAQEVIRILADKYAGCGIDYQEACKVQPLLKKNQGLGFSNRLNSYAASKINDECQNANIYEICKKFNNDFAPDEQFDPYQTTDDIFALVRESGFGFLGIAHPQKLNAIKFISSGLIDQCQSEGQNPAFELVYKWLNMLRGKGLRAMDINYQFDNDDLIEAQKMLLGEEPTDETFGTYQWLKLFVDYADKYGILSSGGYDSHGKDIRARH